MADTDTAPAESETPNQKQARLRREKRQKKMAEQGEDRLAKIKALNGGVAPPAEVLGGPAQSGSVPKPATVQNDDDDPDEADIDTVSGVNTPNRPARTNAQDNPLAAATLQQQQQRQGGGGAGMQGMQGGASEDEDPMIRMMQQLTGMMGGNAQDPNDPNQPPQIPPMLQALMGGGGGGQDAHKAPETGSAYLWRVVHAVFACALAVYITLTSTFNGSKLSRSQSVYDAEEASYGFGPRLFTLFTTAELVLQGCRFFLEKGQLRGPGIFAMVANSGFVPEPYAQWVRTGGRWVGIAQSVVSDAMVVIFVFGVLAWWSGRAVA